VPERSPEIERFVREFIEAKARGDTEAVERAISHGEGVLAIGTDAAEWGEGHEVVAALHAPGEQATRVRPVLEAVEAFREGDVGWAAVRGRFEFEETHVPVRLTVVVRMEDGGWKAVQTHASIGVPDAGS
jgi:SnoaL-like domain